MAGFPSGGFGSQPLLNQQPQSTTTQQPLLGSQPQATQTPTAPVPAGEQQETRLRKEVRTALNIPIGMIKGLISLPTLLWHPDRIPQAAKSVASSLLQTGQDINDLTFPGLVPTIPAHKNVIDRVRGGDSVVQTVVNDLGNIGLVFGGGELAVGKAAAMAGSTSVAMENAAAEASMKAAAFGDPASAATAEELGTKSALAQDKFQRLNSLKLQLKAAASPWSTTWQQGVKEPLLNAASDAQTAAATGQELTPMQQIGKKFGQYFQSAEQRRANTAAQTAAAGIMRDTTGHQFVGALTQAAKRMKELDPAAFPTLEAATRAAHDEILARGAESLGQDTSILPRLADKIVQDPKVSSSLDEAANAYPDFQAKHGDFLNRPSTPAKTKVGQVAEAEAAGQFSQADALRNQSDAANILHDVARDQLYNAAEEAGYKLPPEALEPPTSELGAKIGPKVESSTPGIVKRVGVYDERVRNFKNSIKDARAQADKLDRQGARTLLAGAKADAEHISSVAHPILRPLYDAFNTGRIGTIKNLVNGTITREQAFAELADTEKTLAEGIAKAKAAGFDLGTVKSVDDIFQAPDLIDSIRDASKARGMDQYESWIRDNLYQPLPPNGQVPLGFHQWQDGMIPDPSFKAWNDIKTAKWEKIIGDSPILRNIQKVTNLWRYFVLNTSPGFILRHSLGHTAMALAEVGPTNAVRAFLDGWKSFNETTKAGDTTLMRFADTPGAIHSGGTGAYFSEDAPNFIHRGLDAVNPNIGKLAQHVTPIQWSQKLISTVDSFARSGVFKTTIREDLKALGHETEADALFAKIKNNEALTDQESQFVQHATERALKAQANFNDLTSFERQVVRQFVPFYAFHKGLAKLAFSMPLDHPLRFGALDAIANGMGGFNQEERQNLPDTWLNSLTVGGHLVSMRPLNPFSEAISPMTPQGAPEALGPIPKMAFDFLARKSQAKGTTPQETGAFGNEPVVGANDLIQSAISALPQESLLRNISSYGVGPGVGKFLGVNTLPPDAIAKLQTAYEKQRLAAYKSRQPQLYAKRAQLGLSNARLSGNAPTWGTSGFAQ